jgi:anti-sigma factor RsiW
MDTGPLADLPAELKQHMTRYKAPPGLERRIRHAIAQESGGKAARWTARLSALFTRALPLGLSFACGLLVAVSVVTLRGGSQGEEGIEQQVVAAHVRSLMVDHLFDVASTDQHTVKPWFTGKLDFAPPVTDLAEVGFPLVGGRLDYVNDRAVAALVYRRRGHTINVFVMPASDASAGPRATSQMHGFQVAEWQQGGMRFWAVSDISPHDMQQFELAMRRSE